MTSTLKASLGVMFPSAKQQLSVYFQAGPEMAEHMLKITANYSLLSCLDTPISKVVSVDLHLIRPFETTVDFRPQPFDGAWPSYFNISETDAEHGAPDGGREAIGLSQRLAASVAIASLAPTDLFLEAIALQLHGQLERAICNIRPDEDLNPTATTLSPQQVQQRRFIMDLQALTLDDCHNTHFDLQLQIIWRRDTAGPLVTTYIHLSELVIPFGEPHVLAAVKGDRSQCVAMPLEYVIENPSHHVLSFSIAMEASEDFAFSGPKAASVQLVPFSRHVLQYTICPLVHGVWINPQIKIIDIHWNKLLKVIATGDTKDTKRGISIWVDD